MKNTNPSKTKINLLTSLALSLALLGTEAFAQKAGNGGDGLEAIVAANTNDLKEWILKTKLGDLNLYGLNRKEVVKATLKVIETAKITFTDQALKIGNKERTCLNYPSQMEIVCNRTRFGREISEARYVLLAHEYFGLAGIETNNGDESDYRISSQIREFVEYKAVIRSNGSKADPDKFENKMANLDHNIRQLEGEIDQAINLLEENRKNMDKLSQEMSDNYGNYLKQREKDMAELKRLEQESQKSQAVLDSIYR